MGFWCGSRSMLLTNGSGSCWRFFCFLLFEGTFTSFFKDKKSKRSHETVGQGFSYYFCLMIKESGSGSIPLTNGSGSGRPKNMWIRWVRIRNTDKIIMNFVHAAECRAILFTSLIYILYCWMFIADSVADPHPDPCDPYVFGPPDPHPDPLVRDMDASIIQQK